MLLLYMVWSWTDSNPQGSPMLRAQSHKVTSPSGIGCGIALIIFSIWFMVEVPGKSGLPSNISPRMQPTLHMSTPFVYLNNRDQNVSLKWNSGICRKSHLILKEFKVWERYLVEPRRSSGARYHRVATYSVKAGFTASSWIWERERAKPKSHSLTKQSASNNIFEGCTRHKKITENIVQHLIRCLVDLH